MRLQIEKLGLKFIPEVWYLSIKQLTYLSIWRRETRVNDSASDGRLRVTFHSLCLIGRAKRQQRGARGRDDSISHGGQDQMTGFPPPGLPYSTVPSTHTLKHDVWRVKRRPVLLLLGLVVPCRKNKSWANKCFLPCAHVCTVSVACQQKINEENE